MVGCTTGDACQSYALEEQLQLIPSTELYKLATVAIACGHHAVDYIVGLPRAQEWSADQVFRLLCVTIQRPHLDEDTSIGLQETISSLSQLQNAAKLTDEMLKELVCRELQHGDCYTNMQIFGTLAWQSQLSVASLEELLPICVEHATCCSEAALHEDGLTGDSDLCILCCIITELKTKRERAAGSLGVRHEETMQLLKHAFGHSCYEELLYKALLSAPGPDGAREVRQEVLEAALQLLGWDSEQEERARELIEQLQQAKQIDTAYVKQMLQLALEAGNPEGVKVLLEEVPAAQFLGKGVVRGLLKFARKHKDSCCRELSWAVEGLPAAKQLLEEMS